MTCKREWHPPTFRGPQDIDKLANAGIPDEKTKSELETFGDSLNFQILLINEIITKLKILQYYQLLSGSMALS